jgi:tetratricopeptide (TPR) repeat protein
LCCLRDEPIVKMARRARELRSCFPERKKLIGIIQSMLPAPSGGVAGSSPGTPPALAGFGPDFLLGALGAVNDIAGSTYDATGALPPAESPAGKLRAAALREAQALLQAGDAEGARARAQQLLDQNAADPTAVYIVAKSWLKEGDLESAAKLLSRASVLSGSNDQIQADLEDVRILQRGEATTVNEIRRRMKNRQTLQDGTRLAGYLLDLYPDNLDARIALADGYEASGRLDLAGATFVDAIEAAPSQRLAELTARLERFAAAHDGDPAAHDLLARAYAHDGRLKEAEASFARALELSAADPIFQRSLKTDFAKVYSRLGHEALASGDMTGARRLFERALNISRNDETRTDLADLETRAGEMAFRSGMLGTALRAFGRAAANLPASAAQEKRDRLIKHYEQLASRFEAAGDLKRVVAARNGAFLLDTKNETRKRALADAHDDYGLSLFDSGKFYEAMRAFREALKLFAGDSNYTSHLSDAQQAAA